MPAAEWLASFGSSTRWTSWASPNGCWPKGSRGVEGATPRDDFLFARLASKTASVAANWPGEVSNSSHLVFLPAGFLSSAPRLYVFRPFWPRFDRARRSVRLVVSRAGFLCHSGGVAQLVRAPAS